MQSVERLGELGRCRESLSGEFDCGQEIVGECQVRESADECLPSVDAAGYGDRPSASLRYVEESAVAQD